MNELATRTLAQIVNGNHRTVSVFQKYHLDFCCKGKRSLVQACEEQNISVEDLLNELETVSAAPATGQRYDEMSLTQLADYIVSNHHNYVKNELPILFAYAQKVAAKHGNRHIELMKIFENVAALQEEMIMHLHKEEVVLFPRIKEMEQLSLESGNRGIISGSYVQAPIEMMEQEHDHAGTLTSELRSLTNNYTAPEGACTSFRFLYAALETFESDLHQHVHLENNILFPKAIALAEALR